MQRHVRLPRGSPLSFGGVFWSNQPATATLQLEELGADGAMLRAATLPLTLSAAPKHFSAETTLKEPNAAFVRLAFVPGTSGAYYNVDQLFVDQEKE